MENRGWLASEWKLNAEGRRARFYALTAEGRRALGAELESWRNYVGAVELVLGTR
jgi:DNA-binding PadR family transcriptional regulator